jgi:uncharacterized protein YqjF (DUF2071 family)
MHPAFQKTAHRPWPHPKTPWRWRQSWRDLLFAHWPVPAAALRSLVPNEVAIQEFGGTSWVGIVPFRMSGVMMRPFPDLPGISAFPELNVRLYVEVSGKPGVWFVSLDAANLLAVVAARRLFHLPYFHASMESKTQGDRVQYSSQRLGSGERVAFRATYWPSSAVAEARPGTLEHFLTERYCLYTTDRGGTILRADVHHAPWPLQQARAEIQENLMAQPQGIKIEGPPTLLHFSRRLDVVVWGARRAA